MRNLTADVNGALAFGAQLYPVPQHEVQHFYLHTEGGANSVSSWRGVNLEAKVVTCMAIRTEIGFAILRVRVGTVELLVYLLVTIEKNVLNGHFRLIIQ